MSFEFEFVVWIEFHVALFIAGRFDRLLLLAHVLVVAIGAVEQCRVVQVSSAIVSEEKGWREEVIEKLYSTISKMLVRTTV